MNTYTVWVTETTEWEIEIEAPNEEVAMRLAEEEASNVQTDGKLLGIEIKADEVRLDKLDLLNPFS
tara:strand:+ start:73 stop:270 length:198 start_codon:yes stop_codon:yes gene_type:complete